MASTAHKTEEEKKEHFDNEEEFEKKVEDLYQHVKKSKHFVVYTGAGISTSCGIPDYRSGALTCLPTGPGCWEKAANIQKALRAGQKVNGVSEHRNRNGAGAKKDYKVFIQAAIPSKTHMSIVELQRRGICKFLISTNTDGLHRKSGIPKKMLSELHGNTNLELCRKCGKDYMRDFRCRTAKNTHEHNTGRLCDNPACGGKLYDTIINFGENLRDEDIDNGFEHGAKADVMLVLGSSCRVTPAADILQECKDAGGKLFLCNLQKTPYTKKSTHIYSMIDKLMIRLMEKLGIEIPPFQREMYANFTLNKSATGKENLKLSGIDLSGSPYNIFKSV